jgi:hypothetical protein
MYSGIFVKTPCINFCHLFKDYKDLYRWFHEMTSLPSG